MVDVAMRQNDHANTYDKKEEKVEEIMQGIVRDINLLSASNHLAKKRSLEKIDKFVFDTVYPEHIIRTIFQNLFKPVLKLFDDSMDCTRELSVKLIIRFCCHISKPEEFMPYIIPVIQQRIISDNNHESTEEIRLLLIESLSKLIDICSEKIGIYIDGIILMLIKTLEDPYSEVRKASCSCVCKLAAMCSEQFYLQGESLVPPLLRSLSHQHNKVRSAVLQTIGVTILSTSGKSVDDVFTHIAQRTFDSSSPVRLMVVEVVGKWLVELRDRYSYFAKLIPLLLSGLSDEMSEIRLLSLENFEKAGMLYEEENEVDLKDKREYHVTKSFESFITHNRPRLGCRVLVQQNFSKILPALIHDITDWCVDTRIKAANLLYHLVLYCEDHITMSMELLSNGLYSASQDDEKQVVYQVSRVAELVGKFVEPSVYCKLITKRLELVYNSTSKQIHGTLLILTSYIKGAIPQQIKDELLNITNIIEKTDICSSVDNACQMQLLALFDAIVSKKVDEISCVGCSLFKMILSVIALACNNQVKTEAENQIINLSKTLHLDSRFELFKIYGDRIMESLVKSSAEWSSQSSDCYTYVSLLSQAGPSLFYLLDKAIPIFIQCCDVTKDAEMRQRFFTLMAQLVLNPLTEDVIKKFQVHIDSIIKDAILPNCIWKAGRIAAAVRSVAMSFLWALLQSVLHGNELKKVFNELQMQIITCLDDHNETTRLVTIKVLLKILRVCKGEFTVLQLHAIYPEFLKRLDDASDSVRIVASKAISAYFECLPEDYDRHLFKYHLEYLYKTLLIHMDDRNEIIQKAILGCLKIGACKHPLLLKQLVDDVVLKHRTKQYCEELLHHCEELNKTFLNEPNNMA
ncbi:dynein axonemal assembly factor 5 isoform X2 [Hydra vulgaris]|uniref:Dynein axonemal assembly factor 5 isoform X2 n=1 Tax=Hydra vulgaris TaxID=6087 RepID=A0ABM4BEQ3_HYDVU